MTSKPAFGQNNLTQGDPFSFESVCKVATPPAALTHTASALDATRTLEALAYERAAKMREIEDAWDHPDLSDEQREELMSRMALEAVAPSPELDQKMVNCDQWQRSLDYEVEIAKQERDRWDAMYKSRLARADRFRGYIFKCVAILGGVYRSARVHWAIQKNPSKLIVTDEARLPSRKADPANEKYWVRPVPAPWVLNKDAIKAAIKAGDLKPKECGCKLTQDERLVDKNAKKGKS